MKKRMSNFLSTAWVVVVLTGSSAGAGEATVAVASNFQNPLRRVAIEFQRETGHTVNTVPGSTGKLYAQIIHGAPFDVFLAADRERPRLLEQQGKAVPGSRFTYARGKIVLWSADPARIQGDGTPVLKKGSFQHLALANPKTAPYGKAALAVLIRLNLWEALSPRIVQGENIGQTFQFVASGNAEIGFVALSQVLDPGLKDKGSRWLVPEQWYEAIDQDAVLLKSGEANPAARAFAQYLKSDAARKVIEKYGYGVP